MKKDSYKWVFGKFPIKASKAAECLMDIKAKYKTLTPQVVLKEAKNKKNPLHACFEWDDTIAANKYRIQQARDLITSVRVIKQNGKDKVEVRAFVNIQQNKLGELSTSKTNNVSSQYISVEQALSTEPLKHYTLEIAIRDFETYRKRYDNLKELSPLFRVMDKQIKPKFNKMKNKNTKNKTRIKEKPYLSKSKTVKTRISSGTYKRNQ